MPEQQAGTGASPLDARSPAAGILLFCRMLRAGGMSIGPGQVLDALAAVRTAGIAQADPFYWALRAALVTDPAQFPLFRQAFYVWFRRPDLLARLSAVLAAAECEDAKALQTLRRLAKGGVAAGDDSSGPRPAEGDRAEGASRRELLRRKDFEEMTPAEENLAKQLLREEAAPLKALRTRRYRPSEQGRRYDLRRSMRTMVRNNGQLAELARKQRLRRPPKLVLICDISGSMSRYSRAFLHFAHALGSADRSVHAFVFGTRLTNISRRLREKDADTALARIASDVRDWDGGTRIAQSLRRFNLDWNRRVLAHNAVVILLSDGLERDTGSDLEAQMERLHVSCRELIWLNPVLRYRHFEPRADGIRRMLPHVDRFMPAHNVESLAGLVAVLGGREEGRPWRAWPARAAGR